MATGTISIPHLRQSIGFTSKTRLRQAAQALDAAVETFPDALRAATARRDIGILAPSRSSA